MDTSYAGLNPSTKERLTKTEPSLRLDLYNSNGGNGKRKHGSQLDGGPPLNVLEMNSKQVNKKTPQPALANSAPDG